MKKSSIFFFSIAVSILGVTFLVSLSTILKLDKEVVIESIESKTSRGGKVFNKIKLLSDNKEDIWLMKQNHRELKGEWDELKIVVNKTKRPYKAYFSQLKNGIETEFRVSCFKCHANGPRAIRPNLKSKIINNNFVDRILVFAWNLKIKHYGNIESPQNVKLNEKYRKVPLKYEGQLDNKVIKVESCNLCHGTNSYLGRAQLVYQQKATILHLVRTGQMPPWPFKLFKGDQKALEEQLFLR